MANIRKVVGKSGVSYKITVSLGRDKNGKQLRHYKTFVPPAGMTEKKAGKEAQKIAIQFEEELRLGFQPDNRITFAEYANYFMKTRQKTGLKRSTFERYQGLLTRINPAIGHMKLCEIRPQHLNLFYENLMDSGIRQRQPIATAKPTFCAIIAEQGMGQNELSRRAHIAPSTVQKAREGKSILWEKAVAIADALEYPAESLFTYSDEKEPLSNKSLSRN